LGCLFHVISPNLLAKMSKGDWAMRRKAKRQCRIEIEQLEIRRLLSTIYVSAAAPGRTQDGTSWATAYTNLQQSLSVATSGTTIEVGQGTYKPTSGTDRTVSFNLKDGVGIYGGYAGYGAANPDARNVSAYPTVLSGDIGTAIAPADNSYHVVTATSVNATAVLDGFTITSGNANGTGTNQAVGGGIFDSSGSPTINNCTFSGNTATGTGGGAIYNTNSSPSLANCSFVGDSASNPSKDGFGGAVLDSASSPTFVDCIFSGNSAYYGGAIANNSASSPGFTGCAFSNNLAYTGGGVYDTGSSSPSFNNCAFNGNSVTSGGGGIYNDSSSPIITACTFSGNGGNGVDDEGGTATLTDCTFIGDGIANDGSSPLLSNCVIEGAGTGMADSLQSSPTLTGCTFANNTNGGMYNYDQSSPTLISCVFTGNTTSGNGGGMYNYDYSSPTLVNCAFVDNAANSDGGGMFNVDFSSPSITNCTFASNTEGYGGALYDQQSAPVLKNCILWGDVSEISQSGGTTTIIYSDVQGGYPGTGNINADPQFVRNPSPGPDGKWGTADDDYGNLQLQITSPAIDVGSNVAVPYGITTDLAGNSRIVSTHSATPIVDMGAYEYGMPITITSSSLTASQLSLAFSTNVAASLATSDLQLTPAGGTTSIASAGVSYNSSINTATFDLSNLAGGIYTASISPSAIADTYGNILSAGYGLTFLIVADNQTASLPGTGQSYTIQQLAIGSDAAVDIGSNTLIVTYTSGNDPVSAIASLIDSGYANGQWNGTGIISSATLGEPSNTTGIGYFDDGSEVTIRRSWYGDANLDGQINADDLSLMLLAQMGTRPQPAIRWQDGNFNYDAQVNADDWMKLFYGVAVSEGQMLPAFHSDVVVESSGAAALVTVPLARSVAPAFAPTPIGSATNLTDLLKPSDGVAKDLLQ
jgi:parallel beta-helix repeat protein